jgi:hypothetical protein
MHRFKRKEKKVSRVKNSGNLKIAEDNRYDPQEITGKFRVKKDAKLAKVLKLKKRK